MLRYKEVKQMLAELIADKRNGDRLPSRISLNRQLDSMGDYMDVAYVRGSYTFFRKGVLFLLREGHGMRRSKSMPFIYGTIWLLSDHFSRL